MEAIDNKYLILVKKDGAIDALRGDDEVTVKDKSSLLKLMAKGFTIIIKGFSISSINGNRSLSEAKEIYVDNVTHIFFPSTFKSYEQVSISLELFSYYSNKANVWYSFYDEEEWTLNYAFKEKAKEKLEQAKNRYELEYISKRALMLIYSDGKEESMLEEKGLDDDDNFHLYYLTELYKRSSKLREVLPNFVPYVKGQNNVQHNKINDELINQKVVIFLNQDIGQVVELRTGGLSLFNVLLPKNYGSVAQTEKVEEILKKYPEYRMQLNKWNDMEKRCTSTYLTDELEDIALKKELIRKEGK